MGAPDVIALLAAVVAFVLGLQNWAVIRRMDRIERRQDFDEQNNQRRTKELHDRINPIAQELTAVVKVLNERK